MADDLAPIVLVGGFLTRNSQAYWGNVEQFFTAQGNRRRVIIAPVGACSSLHDRACEIYYSLKGGRIDYGDEHSTQHKHGRYGRKYSKGLYPEWSTDRPLHFVSHSLGGPTVIKLISLLRANFFGNDSHPDMVRSLFAVAAPFKGTPTVYLLGASYQGDQYTLRPFSIGNLISKYIHIHSFLGPLLPHNPDAWDFQPDARNLGIFSLPHRPAEDEAEEEEGGGGTTRRTWMALKRSVGSLLSNLRTSEWADTSDTGSYDSGFHAADARENAGENELNPGTFYCSLTGSITSKHSDSPHHRPHQHFRSDIAMYIMSKMVGSFSYRLSPAPEFLLQKPSSNPVTILSTPEPRNHHKAPRRPMKRRTTTASSLFPPIEEDEDVPADMACLRSMGLHSRVPSRQSTFREPEVESRPSSLTSGSSGWNSSSTRSSYDSVRPLSISTDAVDSRPNGSSSSSPSSPVSPSHVRRHSRRWSSTDWYAQWAERWSEANPQGGEAENVPSVFDSPISVESASPTTESEEKVPALENGKKLRTDLWENDGVVPVFSQHHPSECSIAHCQHHGDLDLSETPSPDACNTLRIGSFMKGVWHVFKSDGMPHDSFVGGLARYESQRARLWKKLAEAMMDLDLASAPSPSVSHHHHHHHAHAHDHDHPLHEDDDTFQFKVAGSDFENDDKLLHTTA